MGRVYEYIMRRLKEKRALHFTLIDPEKQLKKTPGELAEEAADGGTSAFMVGGSTIASSGDMDETILSIKERTDLPVIIFPPGATFLSPKADALFFMSLMNSRNLGFVIREHLKGALFCRKTGVEPLSMGYVVVEPGMRVGEVGEVDLIPREDMEGAISYALAAQYFGMKFFYLEAGSGAPLPVPERMINAVAREVEIPVIVGGGIRGAETARRIVEAGARIVVTGTLIETTQDVKGKVREIVKAIEG
ncbi:MAG: geranylgeranylglyceryl/heptaprenylglyceryl phosphate synthase [Thermoplasmata archaeon]|nr:MAG: geranylgeranylglyceryl/heptaprenylglyceryl phosphate synthase [Thermoplasmata archaeon]RLF70835.1 MAG: geranylgeranylglyceryl/heptaprenylglyceryl phosphate synthase [Thermoplasmata archaeon]RLF72905.1 MAG: geranylgeranylglyceryl/heptaprenylglyceryl phosphate synthase [Thermoplasmata archaeon]RLF74345.1 MAG: geranylgeranylglyceryl/heptaprenylglyceryl phosphate synthase [Thermoplasmata archaeon]